MGSTVYCDDSFHPNGREFVTCSNRKSSQYIQCWTKYGGTLQKFIPMHPSLAPPCIHNLADSGQVASLCLSLSQSNELVYLLWDVASASGRVINESRAGIDLGQITRHCALSPDGKVVASDEDSEVATRNLD